MKKILIIDNDIDILEVLSILLPMHGFNVKTLRNADGILKQIENFTPNLILLDFLLVGVDGSEICRHIKTMETTKNIPIVMFSADARISNIYASCQADGYIDKPFEITVLLEKINKMI